MGPILDGEALAQQAQVNFIDQGGALQGVLPALTAQMMPRQPAQIAKDVGDEQIERLDVSALPSNQKFRYVVGRSRGQ
jgi:hypothetical protein